MGPEEAQCICSTLFRDSKSKDQPIQGQGRRLSKETASWWKTRQYYIAQRIVILKATLGEKHVSELSTSQNKRNSVLFLFHLTWAEVSLEFLAYLTKWGEKTTVKAMVVQKYLNKASPGVLLCILDLEGVWVSHSFMPNWSSIAVSP